MANVGLKELSAQFDSLLSWLVPSNDKTELRALFGNRVTAPAIHHWRVGNGAPPQWARDMVAQETAKRHALARSIQAARVDVAKPGAGLMAWHARRRAHKTKGAPLRAP